MKKGLLFLIVAPLLGIGLAVINVYYQINIRSYSGPSTHFTINAGEPFYKINGRLKKQKMISSTRLFHHYTRYSNNLKNFQIGTFEIKNGMTMVDIMDLLVNGSPITTKVTIPEGKNLFEIAEILHNLGVINNKFSFIELAKDEEFVKSLGIPSHRIEGYLYPDTYRFVPQSDAKTIIKTMVNVFKSKTQNIDFSQSHLNKHDVIILSSIVEKETGAGFERPMIAGVFLNRLKKRMRLQSDPTTIYGIYENYNGNLQKKHLQAKTEYNTYKISGLPKGPISNPGIEAINAVLNPADHQFLYFVSKNDGTHVFTKNYKDHQKAVKEWQLNQKNRLGKSWRDLNKKQN